MIGPQPWSIILGTDEDDMDNLLGFQLYRICPEYSKEGVFSRE